MKRNLYSARLLSRPREKTRLKKMQRDGKHGSVSHRVLSLFGMLTLLLFTAGVSGAAPASDITPTDLRCEGLSNPLGIQAPHPGLSWRCTPGNAKTRGMRQTAYQVEAASTKESLV